jgi:hypothetical protein
MVEPKAASVVIDGRLYSSSIDDYARIVASRRTTAFVRALFASSLRTGSGGGAMSLAWKDSIYRQREALARILREPIEQVSLLCAPYWGSRHRIESIFLNNFARIPYCTAVYALATNGVQVSENVGANGIQPGHLGRDRSQRPYMKEVVPVWGFLLSDAYISLNQHRPSLTALQVVRANDAVLGYIGVDFDLRDLPATADLYQEPGDWRQVKGDPAIRGLLFQQSRVESPLDRSMDQSLTILEELVTQRGIFQCQIHFSSSQATIWLGSDPFRYRLLEHDALTDPDICLVYPCQPYPLDAVIPQAAIPRILENFRVLRVTDDTLYLRLASINIYNGTISLTFSCDGSHYMQYDEFLQKDTDFWFGTPN